MSIDAYSPPAAKDRPKNVFFIFIIGFNGFSIILPAFITFLSISLLFFPFTNTSAENPVHLTCQRLEYIFTTRKASVNGDVILTEEGLKLTADNMELDLASGNGKANGDVHIFLDQGYHMDTNMAEFNINTGWWRIQKADMWLEPSGHIHFQKAEKTDPNTINLIRPRFSTCMGDKPPWEIRGSKGILRPGRSMKIRGLSMRIKGIPVFYLPGAYVPIWNPGSTGIQSPEAGHSSIHGLFLKNRFIWHLTEHTEGRLFLDFFSRTGIGLGTGWKYNPETDNQGSEAKFYLLRENSPEKIHGKTDLSLNIGRSDQKRGVIDIHYATERDFDRRFSSDPALRDLRIGESRAFLTLQKSYLGILGEWEHRRSLIDPNKSEVHQLPKLACHIQPIPLRQAEAGHSPLLGLRISALHMDWDLPEGKGEGESYTIEPGVSFQAPGNHWMNLNSLFSTRQTYYHPTPKFEKEDGDWSQKYIFNLILTGPRIYKDYKRTYKDYNKNTSIKTETFKSIRHFIYPRISYEYETQNGVQSSSIMDIEGDGNEIKNIRFSIINRIWGISPGQAFPVPPTLDLIISQTIQKEDDRQAFELRINTVPHPIVRFNCRGILFTEGSHGKDIDLDLSFGNSDNGQISMGWRHLWDERYSESLNTTRLFLISPLWKGYQISTSFINRIEETYSVFYVHSCWKARIGYIKHIDEDTIRADLNLIF